MKFNIEYLNYIEKFVILIAFKIIFLIKFYIIYFYERTPLHEAVEKENIEIIKLLLKVKGINVNVKDEINQLKIESNLKFSFLMIFIKILYEECR